MKRFNLLIVNSGTTACKRMLKVARKSQKSKFVFEVNDMAEAMPLLNRLNIDMLLVDLDECEINFADYTKRYPKLSIVGAAHDLGSLAIPSERHKVLLKSEFESALREELKDVRKEKAQQRSRINFSLIGSRMPSSDFDFVQLVSSN